MNRGRAYRGGRGKGRKGNRNGNYDNDDGKENNNRNDYENRNRDDNEINADNNNDNNAHIDDNIDNNDLSLVSLLYHEKKFSFACYKELSNEIICDTLEANLESIEEVLLNIKIVCAPTLFLLHPNIISNSHLLQLVLSDADGETQAYRYKAIKSAAWNTDNALDMIQSKLIIKDANNRKIGGHKDQMNYLKLSALIDLDNKMLRQAIGALMTYMQSTVFHLDAGLIYISNISALPITSYMQLDSSTVKALQIFSEEKHPNVIKGTGRSKEGFSVFALFDKTKSLPGRERLKNWMKLPFCDINRIKQRQNGVSLVIRQQNRDFITEINKNMRHIHDIPRLLLRIKKAEAKYNDWIKLYSSLEAAIPIVELMITFIRDKDKNDEDKNYVEHMLGMVGTQEGFGNILYLFGQLRESIDFESSHNTGEILIACGYDQQLDDFRRIYDSLEFQLTIAANKVLDIFPLLEAVSVEYIPQIGYLIAIKDEDTHLLPAYDRNANTFNMEQNNDDFLDFSYSRGGFSYYKHQIVLEMDDSIGDITNLISDRQKNLLRMVEEQLLEKESSLQELSIVLSSLDAIISLGTIAFEYDFIKPEIVNESVIVIKGGRHPLQCISVDNFVPNDTYIAADKNIAIITGPNSSGKSVYLKQVGLLVYLAHLGSFLPAERAIIGVTDIILTRITALESVSSPQSAFSLDLCQISKIIRTHTPRTLCLIDEFGKGTTPIDGISLLATCIKHFISNKAKVLFVVHFTEVLHKDIIDCTLYKDSIQSFQMEMLIDKDMETNNDFRELEATPMYKLGLGIAPSSEGLLCAKAAGMKDSILQRALNIKESMTNKIRIRPIQNKGIDSTNLELVTTFLQTNDWNSQEERINNEGDFQKLKSLINQC